MTKTLVLYVFHQYNNRVKYFIQNAIFNSDDTDFIVICNDKKEDFDVPNYVKILKRDNIGYDFGGWSEALLTDNLYKNYDYFIFINSSVMGPYTVSYYTGRWTDIFINGLKNNIKLFGSTINTLNNPLELSHVQSYVFAVSKDTLEYLIDCEIFSIKQYANTFEEAIWYKEVLLSRKVIEKGWNIGALCNIYKDVDFTFKTKSPENYNILFLGDIMFLQYMNILWFKEELVFVKGNRLSDL